MSNEDIKAGGGGEWGEATNNDVFKSLQTETFQNSPGHQKDNFCMETAGSYSFAFLRYLWLLFYGTVKAYHNLEVVFTQRKMIVLLDHVL